MSLALIPDGMFSAFQGNKSPYSLFAPPHLETAQLSPQKSAFAPKLLDFLAPHWINLPEKLATEFRELARLGKGWDGDEAEPISDLAINSAKSLFHSLLQASESLREPAILPTVDGSIQLEWHDKDRSLEFDFTGVRWVALGVELAEGRTVRRHTTIITNDDYSAAAQCYAWFVRRDPRRAAWPSK